MPQEESELSWFEAFQREMKVHFSEEDFDKYRNWVEAELLVYKEFLPEEGRILDVGCGLGCMAVPLSALGYEVTGIDNDEKVVEAASHNAKRFGGKIKIVYGDVFEIDKKFGKDSFDACISGGVLEHFPKEQIRRLVDKQLFVSPVVIASMPIAVGDVKSKYKDYEKRICKDGIYRNLWTADYWVNNVFKGYNILKKQVDKADESIGGFDEILIVIGRKKN